MGIRIITVSRQFGSGGRTIAKETAERLGWKYYDKELVKKIAEESGLAESYILESVREPLIVRWRLPAALAIP